MPEVAKAKHVLSRRLRRTLNAPEVVWCTRTATSKHYDSRVVLDHLNEVAVSHGGGTQGASFPKRRNKYSASDWWLDDLVWPMEHLTMCAFSDPDGTDLLVVAWGEGAEAVVGNIEQFLDDHE